MSFSANGYARLNDMLNPDIAVLEGGYSIESALPYVNTGIILAMAGLDYSNIHEPDYRPGMLKQDSETNDYVKKVCSDVVNLLKFKKEVQADFRKEISGDYYRRNRNVFYDTDGISEQQAEKIKICDECGGLWTIETSSSRGNSAYAIILPRFCCESCRKTGITEWNTYNKKGVDYLFMQDVDNDEYKVK